MTMLIYVAGSTMHSNASKGCTERLPVSFETVAHCRLDYGHVHVKAGSHACASPAFTLVGGFCFFFFVPHEVGSSSWTTLWWMEASATRHKIITCLVCREREAQQRLDSMLDALRTQRLSVSFETMARCLPDHGQRPHGDYLVVTSVCRMPLDGSVEVVNQAELLQFCVEHALPTNDAWLFASSAAAARARTVLDRVAGDGSPTVEVTGALDKLVEGDKQVFCCTLFVFCFATRLCQVPRCVVFVVHVIATTKIALWPANRLGVTPANP